MLKHRSEICCLEIYAKMGNLKEKYVLIFFKVLLWLSRAFFLIWRTRNFFFEIFFFDLEKKLEILGFLKLSILS
jgi:hypothetical protein